jgi:hypothetical protein
MKNITIILLPIALIALLSSAGFSQKVGSTSMQFLKVMPSARATALGDAYSTWATGVDAVFWNPGGLALIEGQEMAMTYVKWIFDTQQGAIAFASTLGAWGAVGIQFQYVDYGEFIETSPLSPYIKDPLNPGFTGNTFHPFSYLIGVSYSHKLTNKFSTGVTVKYAHESLYDKATIYALVDPNGPNGGTYKNVQTWASGVLFDFGLHYETGFRSVVVGASVQNFGPALEYATSANSAPLAMRFGIAGDLIGSNSLLWVSEDNRLGLAFDLFQPNDYEQQYHAGMEYEFKHLIALRAGYKFNYDAEGFTAGVGLKQAIGTVKFSVDYSYASLAYRLGTVSRISLGVGF